MIQKRCKKHGVNISKGQNNIVRNIGRNRNTMLLTGKRIPNQYPKWKRTNIWKVRVLVLKKIQNFIEIARLMKS